MLARLCFNCSSKDFLRFFRGNIDRIDRLIEYEAYSVSGRGLAIISKDDGQGDCSRSFFWKSGSVLLGPNETGTGNFRCTCCHGPVEWQDLSEDVINLLTKTKATVVSEVQSFGGLARELQRTKVTLDIAAREGSWNLVEKATQRIADLIEKNKANLRRLASGRRLL